MSKIYSIQKDATELERMTEYLEEYVRGDQLYGQPWGAFYEGPSLTIGGMVLRMRRLLALQQQNSLDAEQTRVLTLAMQKHDAVYQEWGVHYRAKMIEEASSRLHVITSFFEDHENDPQMAAASYQPELLRRTIVNEIFHHMNDLNIVDNDLLHEAKKVDEALRAIVKSAVFQWDLYLRDIYPEKEYWWLYTEPVTEMVTS